MSAGFTDQQLVAGMHALRGQICTLSCQREMADALVGRSLMRFHEWPSGHWAITEHGRHFMQAVGASTARGEP